MKEQITGFDLYKLFISLKIHFNTRDYYMRSLIPVKWSKYQSLKEYNVFETLVRSLPFDESFNVREFLIANIISNEHFSSSSLKNRNIFKIYDKWKKDFENIDSLFMSEYYKVLDRLKIKNINELFTLIEERLIKSTKEKQTIHKVSSIQEIVNDRMLFNDTKDNNVLFVLNNSHINFLSILDEIFVMIKRYSFLKKYVDNNKTLSSGRLFQALKYKWLIPERIICAIKQPKIECLIKTAN